MAQAINNKPSLIKVKTIIGQGSCKAGTEKVHGAPLGSDDLKKVKTLYGFNPEETFVIPDEVSSYYKEVKETNIAKEIEWNELFLKYEEKYPVEALELKRRINGELPTDWMNKIPTYSYPENKVCGTRHRSEEVLNALANLLPEIMGGSGDLTHSNLTSIKCTTDFQKNTPEGRYLRFGVREHGMAAICNGLFAHGAMRPFCATFLNFIGYAMGSVRLSALSGFGVIYIMTHDSIGQGSYIYIYIFYMIILLYDYM